MTTCDNQIRFEGHTSIDFSTLLHPSLSPGLLSKSLAENTRSLGSFAQRKESARMAEEIDAARNVELQSAEDGL